MPRQIPRSPSAHLGLDTAPLRLGAWLAAALLLGACQANDPSRPHPGPTDEARSGEPGDSCVQYCESRSGTFMDRCIAETDDTATCEAAWSHAFDACVHAQCSLSIQVPDLPGMESLAVTVATTRLGPHYVLADTAAHYWSADEIGSRVYTFTSTEDGSDAFVELGASLDQPPVVSYGTGPVAAQAQLDHAVERLAEAYGDQGFVLTRRYFTAAHPILEFTTNQGDTFFYSVAQDDVSDTCIVEDDPSADPVQLAVRREGFVREWDRLLSETQP